MYSLTREQKIANLEELEKKLDEKIKKLNQQKQGIQLKKQKLQQQKASNSGENRRLLDVESFEHIKF